MAHALQIDTLAFSKKLKDAGADARLADAIVEGLTAADTSELATKSDILIVENKIDKAESALKSDISNVENKIDKVESKIDKVESALKSDISNVENKIDKVESTLKVEIAEVKVEVAEAKSELTTLIMQSSNRTIYIIGGFIGLLFAIDKLLPLAGIK